MEAGVPSGCKSGEWGDNTAFVVMWWICFVWAASVGAIAVISCFVGFQHIGRVRRMAQGAKTRRGARSYLHCQGSHTLAVGHELGAGMMLDGRHQGCGRRELPVTCRWMGERAERADTSMDNEEDDERAPLLDAGP